MRSLCRFSWCPLAVPLLACTVMTGCIVAAPPDLEEREQIPPRLRMDLINPPNIRPFQTSSTDTSIEFTVDFASEDRGEQILARLYLNYPNEDEREELDVGEKSPGTLGEGARSLTLTWQPSRGLADGCHLLTMAVTYETNYTVDVVPVPRENDKAAFVSWWIVHNSALQDVNLDECNEAAQAIGL